jgi:regulator of sigma E protease
MIYITLTNILAVFLVLGVMILIHELGHFLAAKYFKIKVEVFSIGFGKRLWGFRRGETDYRVCLLPLGGYVKMSGENAGDPTTGSPDEFQSKPRWQRFIVAVMGPTMNIVLAIVLLTGLFMFRYQKPAYQEGPATIGWVELGSPADEAGILVGDRIVEIQNIQDPEWIDVEIRVAAESRQEISVTVERDGERLTHSLTPLPVGRSELGNVGWAPRMSALLQAVDPNLPAAAAGLVAGDEIVEMNGTPINFWPAISELLQENEGEPVQIVYERSGEQFITQIVPQLSDVDADPQQRWRIGVMFKQVMITRQLGFVDAFTESLATNKKFALLIFEFLGKIFTQKLSPRTLEGPIGIARLSGAAARQSFGDLLSLMAAISLNLGIFNLLPIPVLDGGMILLLLIEGTIRRDLSLRLKERFTQVGFAFLVLIAVFVIYNDIVKTLPERFGNFFP